MISFEVNDMTCGHCASTIAKALKGMDKDAKVEIDLASHRVHVEPATAKAEELGQAMKDAGYTPVRLQEGSPAAGKPAASCCGSGAVR